MGAPLRNAWQALDKFGCRGWSRVGAGLRTLQTTTGPEVIVCPNHAWLSYGLNLRLFRREVIHTQEDDTRLENAPASQDLKPSSLTILINGVLHA